MNKVGFALVFAGFAVVSLKNAVDGETAAIRVAYLCLFVLCGVMVAVVTLDE